MNNLNKSILQKILSLVFSTRLMSVLFLVFALFLGVGTFVESEYGTPTAKIWIYEAWWFEAIMLMLLLNFCGNIRRYNLFKRERLSTLLLHLSFIIILIGAFITRYISFEGVLPLREGEISNTFLSDKTYLKLFIDGEIDGEPLRKTLKKELKLTPYTNNDFKISTDFNNQEVLISYKDFIQGVEIGFQENKDGHNYLKLVEASNGNRHEHFVKEGSVVNIHNSLFAMNNWTDGAINLTYKEDSLYITSPFQGSYVKMSSQKKNIVYKDSLQLLVTRALYQLSDIQFVIPKAISRGKIQVVKSYSNDQNTQDGLSLKIESNGEAKSITVLGGKGILNDPETLRVGGLTIHIAYGAEEINLPFSLKLNDFIAEKYPGTKNVYKAFRSEVDIIEEDSVRPYSIYMNHVLDHKGYRFFQSSFHPDEGGTILSVNHDQWGTYTTYTGYILLFVAMLWILFSKTGRVKQLENGLKRTKRRKQKLLPLLLLVLIIPFSYGQSNNSANSLSHSLSNNVETIIKENAVDKEHALMFGSLVIQDERGRMKPINTFSSELLRKLSKSESYLGLTPDQVFLSMFENPRIWLTQSIIELEKENDSIKEILGIPNDQNKISLVDLFTKDGSYKLAPYLEKASSSSNPSKFEKDFLKTHERFYLLNKALSGHILKIFPVPNDANNKWISASEVNQFSIKGNDSLYISQILTIYKQSLINARKTNDYKKPEEYLQSIKKFQQKFGSEILPSKEKIEAEIWLNKYNIFQTLYKYYLVSGIGLVLLVVTQIFSTSKFLKILVNITTIIIITLFALHTIGLGTRWYVSGHAPWSDAYESMIYVAWASLGMGIAFLERSSLTLGASAFVTSIILFFAHQNWIDPAITNLQPVLDSYWVLLHVSIIVGSYGPFFLSAILGLLVMVLIILTNKKRKKKISLTIKELTMISEISLIVGLVMLTTGNFLGGMWANESWGRYWSWDPKETWALVSIMVYAFVIHLRLVPALKSLWLFNTLSVLAISSILMTYFGVNFYLEGLHSYASGDKVVTPNSVYYSLLVWAMISFLSYRKFQKFYKQKSKALHNYEN